MYAASMPQTCVPLMGETAEKEKPNIHPGENEDLDMLASQLTKRSWGSFVLFLVGVGLITASNVILLGPLVTTLLSLGMILYGAGLIAGLISFILLVGGHFSRDHLARALAARRDTGLTLQYRKKTALAKGLLAITTVLSGAYILLNLYVLAVT